MKEQLLSSLSGIIDAVADPIFVKDEQHRWILLNEATCRFMGHPREALLGKSDFDFFPEDEARVFWEKDDEVFRTEKTVENEERFTGADGTTRIISTKKSIYVNDVGEKVLVGVIRDLTDIKSTENELREARDQAERANHAKSRLVANASHELRTPLNGIVGVVDLLLDRDWDEEMGELLHVLRDSAGNLLNLVNDVLEFSALETGKLELKPSRFAPRRLLKSIMALFEPQRRSKNLHLTLNVANNVSQEVVGDQNRIRQVLVNLLSNAVKFTPEGGRVHLGVEQSAPADGTVRLFFTVTDNGIGIPETDLERVFLPFSKAREGDKGTGLGLAIARQLSDLLKGTLRMESESESGCRAYFHVPLTLPTAPSDSRGEEQGGELPSFDGMRILVVEDDPVSQKVARRTLDKLGCSSTVVGDGTEALEILERESFDMILMDCRMPRMDGYETSREIRGRGLVTPIVALTAHAFGEDRERCLAAGMSDWLSKPLIRRQLVEVLNKYRPNQT